MVVHRKLAKSGCWMNRVRRLVAVLLLAAPLPALAQVGTFWSSRNGPQLSGADFDQMFASITRLNAESSIRIGASEDWSNPSTGSHGTSTVTSIFTSDGLPCHGLHHEIAAQGRMPPRPYDLTWCRTSDGTWKIKS
jgi:hypothetical protein